MGGSTVAVSAAGLCSAGCAELAAREHEEHLLFTCEHAGVGVAHLSPEGRWLCSNRIFCQITGYGAEQLRGKTFREITCPADQDKDQGELEQLLAGTLSRYTVEKRLCSGTGALVWVHLTLSLARQPDGSPDYLILVAEDISAQKEAERLGATLAAIVQNSADAIISEDLEGVITSWNAGAEEMFGYRAREILGRPVFLLAPPEKGAEVERILERVRRGKPVHRMEALRIRKNGERFYAAISVSPIRDPAGKVIGIAKIARDITELKRAERALEQARQALAQANGRLEQTVAERTAKLRETVTELEQMSYSIMHDMRAPLRAVTSYGDLIESDPATCLGPDSRRYLERMKTAVGRMDQLIRDVLNYSVVVRQGLDLHPVDLNALLRGIVETYPAFQPPQMQIQLAPDLPPVHGNEAALTQCFSNLLDNAAKFVAPGVQPRVRIWAERADVERRSGGAAERRAVELKDVPPVRIWVEDNGIGIPRRLHERIFGIFQRADTSRQGTGIGLAIVRKAAERMGGRAGVDSEPGRGSRFWLELPGLGKARQQGS